MLDQAAIAPDTIRSIRRVEYERMVEAGLFPDERIELLRGALVAMSPQGARHADATRRLASILIGHLSQRAAVSCQLPFAATDDSEPEPDVAVHPDDNYSRAHPNRAFLVVEIAESSLAKDRAVKAAVYAEAGVAEYWVVDLARGVVEVMTEPSAGGYGRVVVRTRGEGIRLSGFPDVEVRVSDFLRGE
ncbi:MAG TPA: Uma2 family endonuclease [Kofleriaceae bacterium]|nr:Uma2 family endonuclease [Kofleriaceae bacterium]